MTPTDCALNWYRAKICKCNVPGYTYSRTWDICEKQVCDKDCGPNGQCKFDEDFAKLCECNDPDQKPDFFTDKCN